MHRTYFLYILLAGQICLYWLPADSFSQDESSYLPAPVRKAIVNRTRTTNGLPGPDYWQNSADYQINVTFDPVTRQVSGQETITYRNESPHALDSLLLLLLPDMYRQGCPRDFKVAAEDEHPGLVISDFSIGEEKLDPSRQGGGHLRYENTSAWVALPRPVQAGSSCTISMRWEYTLNKGSHMRTGQVDPSSFFIAYWFPRIAVYDDVEGWNNYIYTGVGEFYNDFGDFRVNITVPENFTVWATGELLNPESVFTEETLNQYRQAQQSSEPVQIPGRSYPVGTSPEERKFVTWEYLAMDVSDFAFGLSDHYLWDAFSMQSGPDGRPVMVSAAYNPGSQDFYQVARMAATAINYMTGELPGIPFPYPRITVFNGLDEMEYPMMVNDISNKNLAATFKLTAHEICHSYFPFLTGCNERKYAWMDEGLTSFFEYNMIRDLVDSSLVSVYFLEDYLRILGTERDLPLGTTSELVRAPEYYAISYAKAVAFYSVLMDEIGREAFRESLRVFADRWAGKHPTGFDLLNTFTDESGQDLSWLVTPWMFEYGVVDLEIAGVEKTTDGYSITIRKPGLLPAPIRLLYTDTDGNTGMFHQGPSAWKEGNRDVRLELATRRQLVQLELIQAIPVDADPENDIYRF